MSVSVNHVIQNMV